MNLLLASLRRVEVRVEPQSITDFLKWKNRMAEYNRGTLPEGLAVRRRRTQCISGTRSDASPEAEKLEQGAKQNFNYNSRRPSIAFSIVISSVYSMSLPTGMPMAMRVTFTPARFNCCEK